MISSTLLALNFQANLEEMKTAVTAAICIIEECPFDLPAWLEFKEDIELRGVGVVLPINYSKGELAFLLLPENIDDWLRRLSRLLWESGILLSSKIVLVKPELKLLKNFGERE